MADKDFRIDLILGAKFSEAFRALDTAKRKIGEVEKSAGKFSQGAGAAVGNSIRAAGVAGVAAATAAAAVMSLYIAKTIEAEKVQAQLQSRLKDTAGVAGRTLEQLNNQAGSLQRVTVFDDEAIGNAQAMLLTFTQIRGVNFDKAIASALDLATVMGTDAPSAAKILGKALSEPERGLAALTKAGITFTDAERQRIQKMLEAGQVAKAQAAILEKLEGTMGSAAEAARDTLGGALQAIQNSFDNLLEGDSGDSGIQGTRSAIETLIKTLNDPATKNAFNVIVNGIALATSELIKGVGWWVKWGQARAIAMGGGNIEGFDERAAQKRLDQISNRLNVIANNPTSISGGRDERNNGKNGREWNSLLAEQNRIIEQLRQRNRKKYKDGLAEQGVAAGFAFANANAPDPMPEGQGVAKIPKSKRGGGGAKGDPDADIKRRIASLKEESALLGQVADGEDRASEAAQVRYAITEGEFKNKSPQLKAELLAAAEALDAKSKDIEAEKKRKEAIEESKKAFDDLRRDLRTPTEVAVDEAIAKLKTLSEAAGRGEDAASIGRSQKRIIDAAFGEKAPDAGFGQYDPFQQFEQQRQQLNAWYESQLQMLGEFRQKRADLNAQWDQQEAQVQAQHAAAMSQLQLAQNQMLLGMAAQSFGGLAEMARNFGGEQSETYRVLFAISKGFAAAQAAVSLSIALSKAMEKGWPWSMADTAQVLSQFANITAIISGASFGGGGYAQGGFTGPGGKYQPAGIVHKGEGVLSQEEIAALGGPEGFYRLRSMIDEGLLRDRRGWAGYAAGGLVGAAGPMLSAPDYASYPQGTGSFGASVENRMRVYLLQDQDQLAQRLAQHPAMEKAVVAIAGQNGQAIRADW